MIDVGFALDPGIRRRGRENQDAIAVHPAAPGDHRPTLVVVADGMGGYEGGAVASRLVVQSFGELYRQMTPQSHPLAALKQGVADAHAAMRRMAVEEPRLMQMGSTIAAAMMKDDKIALVNAGDSRAYLVTQTAMCQISHDHSYVGESARRGLILSEEVRTHPRRSVLTMSISVQREQVELFSGEFDWQKGDRLLLCSDGLWSAVTEEQIHKVVIDLSPQQAADELVRLANANQGPDNIAVVVARYIG